MLLSELSPPNGEKRILLHSCCAPCSGAIMEALLTFDIDYTVFFYNPNIHPLKEYEKRKKENKRFATKHHIPFIDADYDSDQWFERTNGMAFEPERGRRCTMCFDIRLERTALYAHENDFKVFTSSVGISRWKDLQQVNECGKHAASLYPGLIYWTYNWRKKGGAQRMITLAKRENFYRQNYCGCIYSLRDTSQKRKGERCELMNVRVNKVRVFLYLV